MIDAASLLVAFVVLYFVACTLEEAPLNVNDAVVRCQARRRPGRLVRRLRGAGADDGCSFQLRQFGSRTGPRPT